MINEQSSNNRQTLIKKIGSLPDQIADLVKGLSNEELTSHYLMKDDGTPEWTVAQNVHHLADSHMNSYIRCKLVLSEAYPTIRPYDQDAWAAQPDAQSVDISDSLAILTHVHRRWVRFFENLSEDEWERTGYHPESGDFSLKDQLKNYVEHGEGHVDQIERTLKAKK